MRIPADILASITFAAFQSRYNVKKKAGWPSAERFWFENPKERALWAGIVNGVIVNCCAGQQNGTIKFDADPGAVVVHGTGPVEAAPVDPGPVSDDDGVPLSFSLDAVRRIRDGMPDAPGTLAPDAPQRYWPVKPPPLHNGHDTPPGLAIGRCTGDDCPDDDKA